MYIKLYICIFIWCKSRAVGMSLFMCGDKVGIVSPVDKTSEYRLDIWNGLAYGVFIHKSHVIQKPTFN